MPTFSEVLRAAQVTLADKTSGARMREIERILRRHRAFSGLTPAKATAILEDLGPTFVKMGQIAADRSDIIPREYAEAFKALRTEVPPLPFATVAGIIERAYGRPWQQVFSWVGEEPLGSASIAQVHCARLAGTEAGAVGSANRAGALAGALAGTTVAVKVRRPRVPEQMAEDLTLIRHAIALADLTHAGSEVKLTLNELVDELERTTAEEVDFCNELANLERFRRVIADEPGIESPRAYPALATDDVLVMEYVTGSQIDNEAAIRAQGADPAALGRRLAESYVAQIVDHGFFHADPHPGNILVRDGAIVWIDLGMTGTLTSSERVLVGQMFRAVVAGDAYGLMESLLGLAQAHGEVDHGLLLEQLSALEARYASADLADIDVGSALLDVLDVLRRQKLVLPSSFTLLARGLVTIEGVLATIAPRISVVEIMGEHVRQRDLTLDSLEARGRSLFTAGMGSAEAAVHLPTQLSHTLDMVDRGQVDIGVDLHLPQDAIAALYSVAGTVALALISAGLFVGSSLIAQTNMEPKLLEVPLLGILGYLGAFVLGVYVIWRTLLTRHRQRNNEKVE